MNLKLTTRTPSKWRSLCCLLLCCGCYPHVELKAPEPTAPLEEREATYEALHIESLEVQQMPETSHGGPAHLAPGIQESRERTDDSTAETRTFAPNAFPSGRRVWRANLGDGTHVYHTADLVPLVAPNSAAAEALKRSAQRRQTAKVLNYVGGGIMLGGASLIGLAGIAAADPSRDDGGVIMGLGAMIGGGTILLGGIVHAVAGGVRGSAKGTDRVAFEHYNSGLALRLHVCADDRVLAPCAARERSLAPDVRDHQD